MSELLKKIGIWGMMIGNEALRKNDFEYEWKQKHIKSKYDSDSYYHHDGIHSGNCAFVCL